MYSLEKLTKLLSLLCRCCLKYPRLGILSGLLVLGGLILLFLTEIARDKWDVLLVYTAISSYIFTLLYRFSQATLDSLNRKLFKSTDDHGTH